VTAVPPETRCGEVAARAARPVAGYVPAPLGIVAGGGRLPLLVAERAAARGRSVHIVGIAGEADAEIARFAHTLVRWGELGHMLQALRRAGCRELVIAGAVRRPNLRRLHPDGGLLVALPRILRLLAAGGDDHVLTHVVGFFEAAGFRVRGAHEVVPELLVRAGCIGALGLGEEARRDAALGFAVRRALQGADAGQAVVVADGRVLAIEGVEGTDAMLQRLAAGRGARRGVGVLAKGPKPGQELRVDMPTIGPRTIANALAAGLAAVVVEAGGVLMLDAAETLRLADGGGCAVHGHEPLPAPAIAPGVVRRRGRVLGVHRPTRHDRRDLEHGLAAVEALANGGIDTATIVARAHVLAIEPSDQGVPMLARVSALRQWGLRGERRRGVFVCRPLMSDREAVADVLGHAAAQRLAGVAVAGAARLIEPYDTAVTLADRLGIFLVVCAEEARAA
jgi:DUF1009 family protein